MDAKKRIHNIVASSVNLELGLKYIENEFMRSVRGYPIKKEPDEQLFRKMRKAARKAIEQTLAEIIVIE